MSDRWLMRIYAAENEDGGVSLVYPNEKYDGSEQQWLEATNLCNAERMEPVYPVQLPNVRDARDAWVLGANAIEIRQDRLES